LLLASAAGGRLMTTISAQGSRSHPCRNDSRTRRLIRLRMTALLAVRRETAMPRRGSPRSWKCASTVKYGSALRAERRKTRANSAPVVRRAARGKRRAPAGPSDPEEPPAGVRA